MKGPGAGSAPQDRKNSPVDHGGVDSCRQPDTFHTKAAIKRFILNFSDAKEKAKIESIMFRVTL